MKHIILFLLISLSNNLYSQEFDAESFIEMLLPKNIDPAKLESNEQIVLQYFYRSDFEDSLRIYKIYKAKYLDNGVLELKSKKKTSSFWETEHYLLKSNDVFWDCNPNGKITYDINFRKYKYEYYREGNDSIVIKRTIDGDKPDSLCMWLDKFVYRNGRLEEKWHKYGPFHGCDWKSGVYEIEKYSYLDTLTKKINYSEIDAKNQKVELNYYCIKKRNEDGNYISHEYFKYDNPIEPSNAYYWIYENDRLIKIRMVQKSVIFEEISFQ